VVLSGNAGLTVRFPARFAEAKAFREAALDDVIAGSFVFTGERSAQSYHLNKMAKTLGSAETRAQFMADEAGYMRGMGCSEEQIALVHQRDWKGLMEHGASIYLLLRIGAAVGHTLPQIGIHTSGKGH
jgi:protocatechuate 4,5-dioxygenase alpha subunit